VTVLARLPRLIDVEAAQASDTVGEKLQRQNRQNRLQVLVRLGDVDDIVGVVLNVLVAVGGDGDHLGARARVSWMFETTLS